MGLKGCWTCRDRKVRCDSGIPSCNNCKTANRICRGYGMQLSWPRDGDKKRALILRDASHAANTRYVHAKHFLHSSSLDVALSEDLQNGKISARRFRSTRFPRPIYLSPTTLSRDASQLLDFFCESRSLLLGPTDEESLAQFILKVAFSEPAGDDNPVLQSVFALASLQLHGKGGSFRYKRYALAAIAVEAVDSLDDKKLLQNLMAAMLLYHYELSLGSNSKDGWVVFFCAVKRAINTAPAAHKLIREEFWVFLDWVFYHEAMSEFAVRHWSVPYVGCGFVPIPRSIGVLEGMTSKIGESIGCPTDVLQLIVHTCRHALIEPSSDLNAASTETERGRLLESGIATAFGEYDRLHSGSFATTDRSNTVAQLHRVASLIYVHRAVHSFLETDGRHRRLVREGISLLTEMVTCQYAWPLFIVASEATDDQQRSAILDVFDHTRRDERRRSSHIHLLQLMVQAVWAQRDLDTGGQVDHMTILDAVIRAVPFMPVFA